MLSFSSSSPYLPATGLQVHITTLIIYIYNKKTEKTTLLVMDYNDHMQRSVSLWVGDSTMLPFLITSKGGVITLCKCNLTIIIYPVGISLLYILLEFDSS